MSTTRILRPGSLGCVLGYGYQGDDAHRFLTDHQVPFFNLPAYDAIHLPFDPRITEAFRDLDVVLLLDHSQVPETPKGRQDANREIQAFLHVLDRLDKTEGSMWEILGMGAFTTLDDRAAIRDVAHIGSIVFKETNQVTVRRSDAVDCYVFHHETSGEKRLISYEHSVHPVTLDRFSRRGVRS